MKKAGVVVSEGEQSVIRGLDSPERLFKFFEAKGHKRIVLRVADVLDLEEKSKEYLMYLCNQVFSSSGVYAKLDNYFKNNFLDYIAIPVSWLAKNMDLPSLEKLQQVLMEYQEVRLGKGEPSRVEDCPKCEGKDPKCKECEGGGKITVYLEMSEEEQRLAEVAD